MQFKQNDKTIDLTKTQESDLNSIKFSVREKVRLLTSKLNL